jgi:AraC-like DNA-binding protein
MAVDPAPLGRFKAVDTCRPDDAREQIGRIFCPHLLLPHGRGAAGFHARHHSAPQPGYSVNFVAYGAEVDIDPGELGSFFLLQLPLAGAARVACGASSTAAEARRAGSILSPSLPTRMTWMAGAEKLIVQLDRTPVERLLGAMTDGAADRVEFATPVPFETPEGATLLHHAELMLAAADATGPLPDAYLTRLRDGLIALLLESLDHSARAHFAAPPAAPSPRAVRRAEAFIEAHAHEPLTMAEIAAHAGVSLRSLQVGFRRCRGTTLSARMQSLRLARFRAALIAAQPGATVAGLAFAAGLGHLGRAAAAYRRRYGETPSETLRRG